MTKQMLALLAGGAFLALAGTASAGTPTRLTDNQMDAVSAGSAAAADGISVTFGEVNSATVTRTSAEVNQIPHVEDVVNAAGAVIGQITVPRSVIAQSFTAGMAAGGFLFNAASASSSQSMAVWQ
jgi:hypothetical protein